MNRVIVCNTHNTRSTVSSGEEYITKQASKLGIRPITTLTLVLDAKVVLIQSKIIYFLILFGLSSARS